MDKILEQSSALKSIKGISHGFFTRNAGVSQGNFSSLNCSLKVGDDADLVLKNREICLDKTGLIEQKLVIPDLVHGDRSMIIGEDTDLQGDAVIANSPIALGITHADCLPILLASLDGEVIAAIHAGWRGIVACVINKTIEKIYQRYGQLKLVAAVGPCVSEQGFLVDGPVLETFSAHWPSFVKKMPNGTGVDLMGIAFKQLYEARVTSVDKVGGFTDLDSSNYFSHRKDKGLTGRHLAIIGKY